MNESNVYPINEKLRKAAEILKVYGVEERLVREKERREITSISRSTCWLLEREGKFPKHKLIGKTNVWLLSDLLIWINEFPRSTESDKSEDSN